MVTRWQLLLSALYHGLVRVGSVKACCCPFMVVSNGDAKQGCCKKATIITRQLCVSSDMWQLLCRLLSDSALGHCRFSSRLEYGCPSSCIQIVFPDKLKGSKGNQHSRASRLASHLLVYCILLVV